MLLFWYLDKVSLLAKSTYMSKEAFAPVYHVERGFQVESSSFIFYRMLVVGPRDKQRPPYLAKVSPYVAVVFSYMLQVALVPSV